MADPELAKEILENVQKNADLHGAMNELDEVKTGMSDQAYRVVADTMMAEYQLTKWRIRRLRREFVEEETRKPLRMAADDGTPNRLLTFAEIRLAVRSLVVTNSLEELTIKKTRTRLLSAFKLREGGAAPCSARGWFRKYVKIAVDECLVEMNDGVYV